MNLSARAYHRVLKLARTIADLAGSERTGPAHIAMPISDRPRSSIGRDGWSESYFCQESIVYQSPNLIISPRSVI
jgi:hypothetical protein